MALAARQRGHRYLAITDHSAGRGIAHGLTVGRLREHLAEIKRLNQSLDGKHILSGSEVDIRGDGSLDFDDELLSQLDVVIASVHSAMGQDEAKMTQRVIRAMNNPHVDILGHPTCRLLGERLPVAINMEAIFQAALQSNTALEINAMPSRLDLKDVHIQRAKELGVKLVIGTDAHNSEQLDHMRFGVGMARRGWCEPEHILNTRPLAEIQRSFGSDAGRKS
jgi:DNA polymerase (family 10)